MEVLTPLIVGGCSFRYSFAGTPPAAINNRWGSEHCSCHLGNLGQGSEIASKKPFYHRQTPCVVKRRPSMPSAVDDHEFDRGAGFLIGGASQLVRLVYGHLRVQPRQGRNVLWLASQQKIQRRNTQHAR